MVRRCKTNAEYDILRDKALAHIKSVPYKPSLRWLFYRMLQDGEYVKTKEDYKWFKDFIAKTRKKQLRGWDWDTLEDDTRGIVWKGIGGFNKKEWLEQLDDCKLDKVQAQKYFVMIFFEANAMFQQFEYYTKNIPLLAFGGDVSLATKDKIAKYLMWASKKYNKPIVILYFGDADKKGNQIYETAMRDIKSRCQVNFKPIYCGLTKKQAKAYKLPVNPEKPNQYQWEAMTDKQAKELISKSVKPYQKKNKKLATIEKEEQKITKWFRKRLGLK